MANIIVVGVDGGEPSLVAARRAAELAAHLGATLHVVTALEGAVEEFPDRPGSTLLTSGEAAYSTAADAARDVASIVGNVTSAVAYGSRRWRWLTKPSASTPASSSSATGGYKASVVCSAVWPAGSPPTRRVMFTSSGLSV